MPEGHIHADLFPDNVFFLDDHLSGLIDFYFAATDFLAYDVAVCLNAWCFEADFSFNVTKGRALLRGYETIRPLSFPERAALPVLCQGAAIRFLLTRLFDWQNTPEGAMVTPPRPAPKINSLINVGVKVLVSEIVGMLPGPFLRSVIVSGQFQDAVVVP